IGLGTQQTSCFAAGTLVWTITGPQPIDQLRVGDLVASLNVETGELAYKPVLRRSLRARTDVVACTVGDESVRCTPNHPVWVAGKSWKDADALSGSYCRTLNNLIQADHVQPAGQAEVYNLEVADFNTYFVGNAGLLVHDVTPVRE